MSDWRRIYEGADLRMLVDGPRVAGAGLLSACAISIVVALFHQVVGLDLFSLTWKYIPIGPLLFGWIAAGGLSIACIQLKVRANTFLRVLSPFIGAGAFVLTYFVQFLLNRRALGADAFYLDYLKIMLNSQSLSIDVSRWTIELGHAEELGYLLGGYRLLAVSVGGWLGFSYLSERPWCDGCRRYLRTAGEREMYFLNAEHYHEHRRMLEHAASEGAFDYLALPSLDRFDEPGIHYVAGSLFECSECGQQVVSEKVQEYRDGSWAFLPGEHRQVALRGNRDLSGPPV